MKREICQDTVITCLVYFSMLGFFVGNYHGITKTSASEISIQESYNFNFRNQTFGVISSPMYPSNYPQNISCQWNIEMLPLSRIVLTIKKFFLWPGDELIIDDSHLPHKVYNLKTPPNEVLYIASKNATITLNTFSNYSEIESIGKDRNLEINNQRVFYALFESEGCGGILTEQKGYITIPQYIHSASRPHECLWTIYAPKNQVITLDFIQFDVQPGSCIYNNVYVRDGDKTGGYKIGDFCEENPPFSQLRTTTNIMTVSYRTRPNLLRNNPVSADQPIIKMYYSIVDNCGGKLEGFSGSFATPKQWTNDVFSCNWSIVVPRGKEIFLKFSKWKIKATFPHDDHFEKIQIIDTSNSNNFLYEYNTGINVTTDNNFPTSILAHSNEVQIIWSSSKNRKSIEPRILFRGSYEATMTKNKNKEDCVIISNQNLFMCDEEKGQDYIRCSQHCDGVSDCRQASDEKNCRLTMSEKDQGVSNSLDTIGRSRFGVFNRTNTNTWAYFIVTCLSVIGVFVVIVMAIVLVERFLRGNKDLFTCDQMMTSPPDEVFSTNRKLDLRRPPPYKKVEDNTWTRLLFQYQPPPPYSFETTTESSGVAMSDNRSSYTPTALFHDTDVIDYSSSGTAITQSYSPTPFRFTDEQDDTDEFLQEVEEFKE